MSFHASAKTSIAGRTWETRSHGDEAERLEDAKQATELADLSSSTALLLSLLTDENIDIVPPIRSLLSSGHELTERLRKIASGVGKDDRDLPYRQLIPVRVWEASTAPESTNASELAESLSSLLEAIEHNKRPANLQQMSEMLEYLSSRLQSFSSKKLRGLRA
ncbi:MAG: hypothetical protein KY462_13765 [Actinobacteria bacterium]|nr:hypothetical protein [Actinomycetota bacterium]